MQRGWLAVFVVALLAVSVSAQVSTSRLEGTVQDQTGAVVPGAKVEVVNIKTGIKSNTEANAQGAYIFPSLTPGTYTMTVELQGFRKATIANVELNVAATLTQVVKLEIGSVSESVVVEANAVRVQTADAQIGRSVTLRDIDVLPQLGRGPITLAIFNPGVQIDGGDTTYSHVNGARQGSNNTTLDGIEVNDPVAPRLGLVMTPTTTDTVEEFRIITNGGKAEYGRSAGGQVQLITRSGTNKFHGGAWDFHRNTATNANNFFSNQSGQTRPKYIRNIFGGKFEGPIKKDRTFFFGNFEGGRTHQEVVRNRTVLTPEIKAGIYRWRTNASSPIQSFDIFRNDPRGKGMDPAVKKLVDMLPNPNNTDLGDTLNTAGFRFNAPANSYNDQYTIKVDHNLWDGHRTFFRWSWSRTYSIDTTNNQERIFPDQLDGKQGGHRAGWSAGSDWTLTNTLINEFRVGGQKTNSDFLRPARLPGPMLISNTYDDPLRTSFFQGRTVPYTEFTDNLSKIYGKHTLKAGLNLRFTKQYGVRDDYIWQNVYLTVANGNNPPANLGPQTPNITSADRVIYERHYNELLGRISYTLGRFYSDLEKFLPAGQSRERTHLYHEYGFFLQDDWKVSSRLMLNLGLRYEFFGVPFEATGIQGGLDKAAQMNAVTKMTDLSVKKGLPFYNNDWNNFAPRVGFAWDINGDGKTAIRGNWGMFYDRMINSTLSAVDLNTPGFSNDVRSYPNQATGSDWRVSDGIPAMVQPSSPVLTIPSTRGATGTALSPNLRTGYVMQFGFNVQRELLRNTVVEAGYVGSRGVKLFMQTNLNQPRIYEDFLSAFKQLQAYRKDKTPVPAGNTLVRLFGTADAAVTAVGATNLDTGAVSTAANTVDTNNYSRYAAAGLPDTYLRNYPQFGYMYWGDNQGRSYYNSFQLSFRRQAGAFRFNANYTFSKSIDNWANEGNGTDSASVMDSFNTRLMRGISDFNRAHSLNTNFMYTLPIGKGRRWLGSAPKAVDSLLGGWEFGVLNIWQSGTPFTVLSTRYTGPNQGGYSRANFTGDQKIGSLDKRGDGVFLFSDANKAQFSFPEAGSIGSSGRNAFHGPRFFNVDASLLKRFRVTESSAFMFRAEAYNLFNNANFGTPGLNIGSPNAFGKFSTTTGTARTMQLGLRFDF